MWGRNRSADAAAMGAVDSQVELLEDRTLLATIGEADIAVVGWNSDGTDDWAIVTLRDIAANEVVFFTDAGWQEPSNTFSGSAFDSVLTWTVDADGVPAGTILSDATLGSQGTPSGDLSFDNNGDQLLIYQTADDMSGSTPIFIYGFNNNNFGATNGWQNSDTVGGASSSVPEGLTAVTTDGGAGSAFGLLNETADNYRYEGPTSDADKATWLSRIHTTGNWTTDDTNPLSLAPTVIGNPDTSGTVVVTDAPSNTAPTIMVAAALNYTEDQDSGDPVQISSSATASDADGAADWNGGTLTVQITGNPEVGDEISIPDNPVGINTNGTNLRNVGTTIGTLSASEGTVTNNTTLTITFNGNATNTLVQQVVRAISYRTTSDTPGTSNRTVTFTVTDTNAGTNNDATTIIVMANNDAPAFANLDATPSVAHRGAAQVLDANATVSDAELDAANNYNGATLQFQRNGGAVAGDTFVNSGTLEALTHGGVLRVDSTTIGTVTTNQNGTMLWTFNGSATSALVDSALQQVAYANHENTPPNNVQIDYLFDDGAGSNNTATGSVTVTITGTTSIVHSGGNVTITDIDGPADTQDSLVITINATNVRITDATNALQASGGGGINQFNQNTIDIPTATLDGNTLTINTLGGNDRVTVDYSNGPLNFDIVFNGGAQDDALGVIGDATDDTATYTPHASATGNGSISIDDGTANTITFTGLEPVDISGMATATLSLPGANDSLIIANGFDDATGAVPALVVSGTSNLVNIEQAHFFNNAQVVIDTVTGGSDGNDTVTINSADNDHDNLGLSIITGTGTDAVNINGNVTLEAGGNFSVSSAGPITTMTGITVTTSGSGSVSLTSDRNILLNDGSSITTVDGGITLNANTAGTTTGNFVGVYIDRATLATSGDGNIQITGRGAANGNADVFQVGVRLAGSDAGRIESSDTSATAGTITINGTGGAGTDSNYGILIDGVVTSEMGAILLTGMGGNGTSLLNLGVSIAPSGRVSSTGLGANAATITINGTGGTGTSQHIGVHVQGEIESVDGAISITGIGGDGSGTVNYGVEIFGRHVAATGTGV